jgi:lysophospholipase L1-like esterase
MLLFIIISSSIYILFEASTMVSDGLTARRLGRAAIPFHRSVEEPNATVMFIGDSTTVGTGASRASQSLAGRLAQDFPNTTIMNHGVNGIGSRELLTLLSEHPEWRSDLLIINIGGIDILGLRPLRSFKKNILSILQHAAPLSPRILILTSSNIGSIPYFRFPISLFFGWRARYIRRFMLEQARTKRFVYVDLYDKPKDDPFLKDRQRFFAPDHIHPSGEGYAFWYHRLKKSLRDHGWETLLQKKQ